MPSYRGFFLNLDRAENRRQAMIQHLTEIGVVSNYQGFAAIDGKAIAPAKPTKLSPGELGIWLTHEKLMTANRQGDLHLHVLEDDAMLPKDAAAQFERLLAMANAVTPDWDIIFTDIYLHGTDMALFHTMMQMKEAYRLRGEMRLASLKPVLFASAASFFINRRSIEKYLSLIAGRWTEGIAIDNFIRVLVQQGLLNAYVTLPLLTTLSTRANESEIRGDLNVSNKVMDLYRRAAFKDADLGALNAEMEELTRGSGVSLFANIFLKHLAFSLSDKYEGPKNSGG
ncbi:MAG: glycosyltransferase family 25 protein [Tepidisphaeraceae bacterium]|jgi:GR25 family glycosyltransferase involved in LPS biosynthesis